MKKTLIAALLASAFTGPAIAADSPHTVTGNLNFANNYFYRGLSQTDDKPALQGGFDYSHSSGFYLGTWASNVSWLDATGKSSLEWDVYGGYKFSAGPLNFDMGLLQYFYPGTDVVGGTSPETLEVYGAVTWKWFTAKLSYATTNLFGVANSDGSIYPELNAAFELGAGFNAAAHVGRQQINDNTGDYTDYKIGVTKDFAGFTWGVHYIDTTITKPRALVTVGKTF